MSSRPPGRAVQIFFLDYISVREYALVLINPTLFYWIKVSGVLSSLLYGPC